MNDLKVMYFSKRVSTLSTKHSERCLGQVSHFQNYAITQNANLQNFVLAKWSGNQSILPRFKCKLNIASWNPWVNILVRIRIIISSLVFGFPIQHSVQFNWNPMRKQLDLPPMDRILFPAWRHSSSFLTVSGHYQVHGSVSEPDFCFILTRLPWPSFVQCLGASLWPRDEPMIQGMRFTWCPVQVCQGN